MGRRFNRLDWSGFVFAGDADNLSHLEEADRGFIDVLEFSDLLQRRGVTEATMFGNWFSGRELGLWNAEGVECLSTMRNADEAIEEFVRVRVRSGASRILLGSGDGKAFAHMTHELKSQGVAIHVLSNQRRLSRELREAATGYAYCDRFVHGHALLQPRLAA